MSPAAMNVDANQGEPLRDDIANLTNSMSALKFVPTSVLMRHDKGKSKANPDGTR